MGIAGLIVLLVLGGGAAFALKLGPFGAPASPTPSIGVLPSGIRPSIGPLPSFNVSFPPVPTFSIPPLPSGLATPPPVTLPPLPSGLPSFSIPPLPSGFPSFSIPPLPSGFPSFSIPPLPSGFPSFSIPPLPSLPTGTFPNAAEQALLSHVPEDIRSTCARASAPTADSSADLICTVIDTTTFTATVVQYSQMADAASMNASYQGMVLALGATADSSGDCETDPWPQENDYVIGSDPNAPTAGRFVCGVLGGTIPEIAWTDDSLNIYSFVLRLDNEQKELYTFWTNAGPI